MQIPGLKSRKFIGGMMLTFLLAQLFSLHFHFEHVEQDHNVHVHSSLTTDHDPIQSDLSDHGEEDDSGFMGSFGKKFSSFDLLVIFSFILILSMRIQRHLTVVDVRRLHWLYRYFFSPPLRAPPL